MISYLNSLANYIDLDVPTKLTFKTIIYDSSLHIQHLGG